MTFRHHTDWRTWPAGRRVSPGSRHHDHEFGEPRGRPILGELKEEPHGLPTTLGVTTTSGSGGPGQFHAVFVEDAPAGVEGLDAHGLPSGPGTSGGCGVIGIGDDRSDEVIPSAEPLEDL